MITKKDILKMVKDVRKRSQGKQGRQLINPQREWMRGLFLSLAILVIGLGFSGFLYTSYTEIGTTVEVSPSNVVRYDENGIARALEQYADKQKVYNALLNPVIVTPPPAATSTESGAAEGEEVDGETADEGEESVGDETEVVSEDNAPAEEVGGEVAEDPVVVEEQPVEPEEPVVFDSTTAIFE